MFSTDRQRLAAVEQLSLVASHILDPTELTRVALDEIIKLLAADRAYLFLIDATDHLVPHPHRRDRPRHARHVHRGRQRRRHHLRRDRPQGRDPLRARHARNGG